MSNPVLAAAELELGVHEEPLGSNRGPRVELYQSLDWLNGGGYAWCVDFAWCFVVWNRVLKKPNPYPTASVAQLESWARKNGWSIGWPKPGDLCCFGGRHVTIYARPRANRPGWFVGLGGNQSDRVQYSDYRLADVTTAIRIPARLTPHNTPGPTKKPIYEVVKGEGEKSKIVFTGNLGQAQKVIGNALRSGARVVRIRRK